MSDLFLSVPLKLRLPELRLLYSLCAGTLKIPKAKKKFGIEEYNRLKFLRDYLKSEIDKLESGELQK